MLGEITGREVLQARRTCLGDGAQDSKVLGVVIEQKVKGGGHMVRSHSCGSSSHKGLIAK